MQVQGLDSNSIYTFELPDPPSKKLIVGYNEHIADQYWKRPYTFTDEEFSHFSYERQSEIDEIEAFRCEHGYWFMNQGEPFYLTGDNYFFLTHWTSEERHFSFIKNQAYDFYFYDFCEKDEHCFGSAEMKPRQEGSTAKKLAIYVNRAIRVRGKHFGIQSKTGDDAENVNFRGIKEGFSNIPYFMKPRVKAEGVSSELSFSQPAKRYTRTKTSTQYDNTAFTDKSMYLNTYIDWKTTKVKAYDGKHLYRYIQDEYFKWENADAYETWLTVRRALGDEFEMWGKAFLLSTIGTDDEKEKVSEDAILSGIKLWNGSSYAEKDSMGYTSTGLYRWFIPTYRSKRGKVLDKYGNVDEEYVKRVLMERRNKEKDPRRRKTLIRQDPMNPQEALSTMGDVGGTFVNIEQRLLDRMNFLKDYEGTPERPTKYRVGNLKWVDQPFGRVRFEDDPEGRFSIAYFPSVAGHGMENRFKEIGEGRYAAYSDSQFVIGLDPIEYNEVQYGKGSEAGFHVKLKYNIFNPELSDIYCLEYLGRPNIPIFREDLFKAILFYGAKVSIERQSAQALFDEMIRSGLRAFILRRQVSWNKKTDKDKSFGNPTSQRSINIGLEYIENYFSEPNPELNENEKDNLQYFWFDRTIKQCLEYSIKEKVKFDLVSSMMQTEFASKSTKKYDPMKAREEQEQLRNPNRKSLIDYLYPIQVKGEFVTHQSFDDLNARPHRRATLQRK